MNEETEEISTSQGQPGCLKHNREDDADGDGGDTLCWRHTFPEPGQAPSSAGFPFTILHKYSVYERHNKCAEVVPRFSDNPERQNLLIIIVKLGEVLFC